MDCSLPGSSGRVILQPRILESGAIPFSRALSDSRIEPRSPALQTDSILSESPSKPCLKSYQFPNVSNNTKAMVLGGK